MLDELEALATGEVLDDAPLVFDTKREAEQLARLCGPDDGAWCYRAVRDDGGWAVAIRDDGGGAVGYL